MKIRGQGSGIRGKYIFLAIMLFFCCSGIVAAADVNELIFQGADYHYKGNLDKALSSFEQAIQLDPENEYAHNQLGILYGKKDEFDKAFREFLTVADIDRQNTFALLWLGILHLRKGEMNQAFERFNKIIQIDPNSADSYYFLGTIYNFRRNPVMAIEYLKKARNADSGEADTHFRLAKAFHNADMIANALLEYNRTLEIKPSYTKALNEIGWIYYNTGKKEAAIKQWGKTLEINSNDRDAILNLAKVYNDSAWDAFTSGKKGDALKYWQKTLNINPGNKAAKYYMATYGSGK
ncbi:MAG TPA: tetratricopeptide repeat protein [Anaerolineae bacterium]|nr:tetratricopeptide repeat protein [Anaerolineae bacterium]